MGEEGRGSDTEGGEEDPDVEMVLEGDEGFKVGRMTEWQEPPPPPHFNQDMLKNCHARLQSCLP